MKNKQAHKRTPKSEYYPIFQQVPQPTSFGDLPEIDFGEMDEIERMRRIVLEVSDENPIFMTTT